LIENFDRFNFAIHKEKEMADFRRCILAFATLVLVLGLVAPASAQQSLNCTVSAAVTPNLRHEGFTELTGDILLTCIPGQGSVPTPPGSFIPQANFTVSLSAPVTSRILGSPATEALLLIDNPSPTNQDICGSPTNPAIACQVMGDGGLTFNQPGKFNVFQGIMGGPGTNSVTFLGIPVDPPTTSRTFRITNIRIDATSVPAGAAGLSPVFAFVSVSPSSSVTINNPQNYVGFVSNGLNVSTTPLNPHFLQCVTDNQQVGTVTFTENFATAFKVRTNGLQNVPNQIYYSESGLELTLPSELETGLADTGTRLQTTISNIPSGVIISASTYAVSPASVGTVLSDATMVSPVTGTTGGGVVAVTDGTQSSVTLIWEVFNTNSFAIDSLSFQIFASFIGAPGNPGSPMVNTTAMAMSGFSPQLPSYSSSGPIPEFSSSVNIQTPGTNLFQVTLCQTILLFPYITDFFGFDTGIAISNTSLDNLAIGAAPQTGACQVNFYGASTALPGGGAATSLGSSGVYSSTVDTSLTNGLINPGMTWSFSLSQIDPGYNSTSTYGTTGYAIATCNFQYAHGYSFVSDTGIRNFAAAYLALIIPDVPRAPQPFSCTGTAGCVGESGEQLVH
jgi:hypothetical protein